MKKNNEFMEIQGNSITRVEVIHDYVQLYLSDNSIVNIFNKFKIHQRNKCEAEVPVGVLIRDVKFSDAEFRISFDGGQVLIVDLTDGAYQGPEALVYINGTGKMVVIQ